MASPRQAEREQLRVLGEREFVASLVRDTQTPVLEIGAGTCACLTLVLAVHDFRILAIDQDAIALPDARKVFAGVDLLRRVTLMQAAAVALPLRPASTRTVVAYDALHHAKDLIGAVSEIANILHPRGRLIVSDWDEPADGFLGRLTRALRTRFRNVVVIPRDVRRVYVCERPRRLARRARPWSRRKLSARR